MKTADVPMPDAFQSRQVLRKDLFIGAPTQERKVMISDPRNNRHYLVNATTMSVLTRFDGTRTEAEILHGLSNEGLRVSEEVLAAMTAKAAAIGLFEGADNQAPVVPHLRGPSRRNPLFFQIFEFDPHRVVKALQPLGRVLFSKGVAVTLLAAMIGAVLAISANTSRYIEDLSSFANLRAWVLVYIGSVFVTVLHEFGHAVAVGRFGGTVHRMGLALYLLSPAAFTDTSSAYAFGRTRHRVIVSLAGIYVESIILTFCILWWDADVLPPLANAVVVIGGHLILARILVNLNPLLRLDGYWLVSDLLKIPNMRAKAFSVLLGTIAPTAANKKRLSFLNSGEERLVLLVYAIFSLVSIIFGLSIAFTLLDQLARRYWEWFGGPASAVLAVVVVTVALTSGWKYFRSLQGAAFVKGESNGK